MRNGKKPIITRANCQFTARDTITAPNTLTAVSHRLAKSIPVACRVVWGGSAHGGERIRLGGIEKLGGVGREWREN
jgi:hypothetical protein